MVTGYPCGPACRRALLPTEPTAGDALPASRTLCAPAGMDIDLQPPGRPPRNALAPMAPRQPLQRASVARRGRIQPTPANPELPDAQECDRVRPPSVWSAMSVGSRLDDDVLQREDRMAFDGPRRVSALRSAPPEPSPTALEIAPWPTPTR